MRWTQDLTYPHHNRYNFGITSHLNLTLSNPNQEINNMEKSHVKGEFVMKF